MEDIIKHLRRKSQLLYDMNCIRKYIEGGDFDQNLKRAWNEYNNELNEIEEKIKHIKEPELIKLEQKKLELLALIQDHQDKISHLKQQLKDLNKMIMKVKPV